MNKKANTTILILILIVIALLLFNYAKPLGMVSSSDLLECQNGVANKEERDYDCTGCIELTREKIECLNYYGKSVSYDRIGWYSALCEKEWSETEITHRNCLEGSLPSPCIGIDNCCITDESCVMDFGEGYYCIEENMICVKNVECVTSDDCEGKIHIECIGHWECINNECVWVCEEECTNGDVQKYECSDGTLVDWCTCVNSQWSCVDNPVEQCKKPCGGLFSIK